MTDSRRICRVSKILAERAAWDVVERDKDEIEWDFVVINLPFVLVPIIQEVTTSATLNASMDKCF